MKSKQFCSVCKEWLEMEVVPTGDGEDDDGVVWYRCPQCQGFLPKLKGSDPAAAGSDASVPDQGADTDPGDGVGDVPAVSGGEPDAETEPAADLDEDLPWDSPADMMASQLAGEAPAADPEPDPESLPDPLPDPDDALLGEPAEDSSPEASTDKAADKEEGKGEPPEPIAEYQELLERADQGEPKPYRPWDTYEVGDCIVHLAWEDCGIVVAKEDLPGGRQVIKCFFGEAGVVRLIEKAPK